MTDNDALATLLREVVPPVPETAPRRDLWSATCARLERHPRWSPMDVGLVVALAALLVLYPQRFLLLAYFV